MDAHDALRILNAELKRNAADSKMRSPYAEEQDDPDAEIGGISTYLHDRLGQPVATSAAYAGLRLDAMKALMLKASMAQISIGDVIGNVAFLTGSQLRKFLHDHKGLRQIIASFSDTDALYMSQVNPKRLTYRFGLGKNDINLPHMLVEATDREWAAVADVQVGYGGRGPSDAHRVLSRVSGIPPDVAREIAYSRVSRVTFQEGRVKEAFHTDVWPQVHLPEPRPISNYFVVQLKPDCLEVPSKPRVGPENTSNNFYSTQSPNPSLNDALDYIRNCSGDWLRGSLRFRLYLRQDAAIHDGYTSDGCHSFPLIFEQESIQLWVPAEALRVGMEICLLEAAAPAISAAGFANILEQHGSKGRMRRALFMQRATAGRPYIEGFPLRWSPTERER